MQVPDANWIQTIEQLYTMGSRFYIDINGCICGPLPNVYLFIYIYIFIYIYLHFFIYI